MEKTVVAVVGCGRISEAAHFPALSKMENVRIKYACDLIEFIKTHGDFCVGGACYPEGHVESDSFSADLENLKH